MNPAVIVRDAAASVLLVIIEVRRQDHRLRLRWWFSASHAYSVAGVSSVPPGVADRPPHEQPTGQIEERQPASLGFRSHYSDNLVNAFRSLALIWPPLIHLLLRFAALAR
jgi:hypothetical protein